MTYNKFIESIISNRGQWNIPNGVLYEVHHIIPRCKGGLPLQWNHDTKHNNLIWLTLEEHYTAHELLAKENPNDQDLNCAWWAMCTLNGVKDILTPEQYAEARTSVWSEQRLLEFSKSRQNEGNPAFNTKWYNNGIKEIRVKGLPPEGYIPGRLPVKPETCKKHSDALTGRKRGIRSKEWCEKLSKGQKERYSKMSPEERKTGPFTEEHKANLSKAAKARYAKNFITSNL